jgi:hypothetical protein
MKKIHPVLLVGFAFNLLPCAAQSPDSSAGQVIFQQPTLDGISGNFHVPLAEHKYPSDHPFNLLLWQKNPNRPDGQLVPTTWAAGDMTGFYPTPPLEKKEAAFRDVPGSSTLQVDGDTIGVYLKSSDLPVGTDFGKMMITPAYMVPKDEEIYPFATPGTAIFESLDLQIPVAQALSKPGSMAYAVADLVLLDRQTHMRITYGVALFHYLSRLAPRPSIDRLHQTEVGKYDAPSHSFQVGNPADPGSRVLTLLPGSDLFQTRPWKGWKTFRVAITVENFQAALRALAAVQGAKFNLSVNPADYRVTEWHLNAELQTSSGPAEMGWSMRGAKVALVPAAQLNAMASPPP